MKRTKKLFSMLTSTLLCTSMLAACGQSAPASSSSPAAPAAPAATTAASGSSGKIKVGIINNDPNESG